MDIVIKEEEDEYSSGDSATNSASAGSSSAKKRTFSEYRNDWKLEVDTKSASVPPTKRRKVNLVHAARALEWFYEVLASAAHPCVGWVGSQGHFMVHDADKFLEEFTVMRGKPEYKLATVLHNFFRPYNFAEIKGVKKIQNKNVYISLDIDMAASMPNAEVSVFRPGNRNKLAYIMHRGTGLPFRRFFTEGVFSQSSPDDRLQPPPAIVPITIELATTTSKPIGTKPKPPGIETMIRSGLTEDLSKSLPMTANIIAEAPELDGEAKRALDNILSSTAKTWISWHTKTQEAQLDGMAAEQLLRVSTTVSRRLSDEISEDEGDDQSLTAPSTPISDDDD